MRVRQNGKLFSSALVAALLLVTAGTLAAQDVRYNFMPRTDFSKYRTYKWVNIRGAHPQFFSRALPRNPDFECRTLNWPGSAHNFPSFDGPTKFPAATPCTIATS